MPTSSGRSASCASRFAKVIWVPGNHELWTHPRDTSELRGVERYDHLVAMCRRLGVLTPEDPYPVWDAGPQDKPVVIAPLFLLYDYTFRPDGANTKAEALEQAYATGIVCTDEMLLHPDPYPSIDAWCEARLALTERRLAELPPGTQTILVNHFPIVREPTRVLRYPVFAQWCGTERTADWPTRFRAATVVYGHLHIPRTIWHDGVRHEEVSLGYPREWQRRDRPPADPAPDPAGLITTCPRRQRGQLDPAFTQPRSITLSGRKLCAGPFPRQRLASHSSSNSASRSGASPIPSRGVTGSVA